MIDCSPEGHQPEVATRIFQGVQHPVCIVLASRWSAEAKDQPAVVRWRALPEGHRNGKFEALAALRLDAPGWQACPSEGRAPFLPQSTGAWAGHPALADFFIYDGSGVMPGRTWVIAPDADSLQRRWAQLGAAPTANKEQLFHPHLAKKGMGDRHVARVVSTALHGYPISGKSVAQESAPCVPPVAYGHRSFDRQWIIPDVRLINRPNPELWEMRSLVQVYFTAPHDRAPTDGPSLTACAAVPDLHHYNGRGGRVFPLWADAEATRPNLRPALLAHLSAAYAQPVSAEDLFAYIAAVAAHPAYIERFRNDLATPGLRIPLTANAATFVDAAAIGRRVVWLHTFGERFDDAAAGRPKSAPRLPAGRQPKVPVGGAIPSDNVGMPDLLSYDATAQRLTVGAGRIEPVPPAVWHYEVSGKQVLMQWFSYRRKDRERPLIGDRRQPSPLGDIQPDSWPAEYTSELLNVLNVLGLLVDLEPAQAAMLERICSGPLLDAEVLRGEGVFSDLPAAHKPARRGAAGPDLFSGIG